MAVFPYFSNKTRTSQLDREHYLSEPYSGDPKALVRGQPKRVFTLTFLNRTQAEFLAAETFWISHYPLTTFTFNDYRFFPARAHTVRFISPLREQGNDVTLRFNYSFDVIEVT